MITWIVFKMIDSIFNNTYKRAQLTGSFIFSLLRIKSKPPNRRREKNYVRFNHFIRNIDFLNTRYGLRRIRWRRNRVITCKADYSGICLIHCHKINRKILRKFRRQMLMDDKNLLFVMLFAGIAYMAFGPMGLIVVGLLLMMKKN